MTTPPITQEERAKAQERVRRYLYIAKNGYPEIKWDDRTVTPAGDKSFEDAAQSSAGLLLALHLEKYEAALTASEARERELKEALGLVMDQSEADMKTAHEAICKLQGLDPAKHDWPEWSPQANSRRWFLELRLRFNLSRRTSPAALAPLKEIMDERP